LIKKGSNLRPTTQVGDDRPADGDQLQPGQRIIHATFGRGTVVVLRGPPDARVAIIEFDKHGAKELQLNFALPKITLAG
jgi:DNA helicase-2/ATP-dependent DNA helicase PcrA